MDTDRPPTEFTRNKRQRQIRGMLKTCGLLHWHETLEAWLADYVDLSRIVDDDDEEPHAAVMSLLREACRLSSRPNDDEFAAMLADLDFFHYRILRTAPAPRPSFEGAEVWNPTVNSLKAFCAGGYVIGGYRGLTAYPPPDVTIRHLLRALRQHRRHE